MPHENGEGSDRRRLIEVAFPLKQASLDSVHEKNVRHGHISTLHIWPARRPLAASRAALIATLLPDPGTDEQRKRIVERIGGSITRTVEHKKLAGRTVEVEKEETLGGVLHWGRESSPDLEWFRHEILKAYGGRAPRVLDPFAGGGAIPFEAMRLGCEVTAADINPVAWFILRCTLEYPHRLANQHRPLPPFALQAPEFMEVFFKGTKKLTKRQLERNLEAVQKHLFPPPDVGLAWHVRAWGWRVLQEARRELARFYPTYAEFQPTQDLDNWRRSQPAGGRRMALVPLDADGRAEVFKLNAAFDADYLADPAKPRWVAKPTVAYLWARTVSCKNCRAMIPLLKTRWLCKKEDKRVLLVMQATADGTRVEFGVQEDVPLIGGNAAQRREQDKKLGQGTMSRAGAWCPCCGKPGTVSMKMEDIRQEGLAGRLGAVMTVVVVDGANGKEYRLPIDAEIRAAQDAGEELQGVFSRIPHGPLDEPTPRGGSGASRAFSVDGYGFDKWSKLFTSRQLLALGTFMLETRATAARLREAGYPEQWVEAICAYLALAVDRLADRGSTICHLDVGRETVANTFTGFRLPISWDFAEASPTGDRTGSYDGQLEWVARFIDHAVDAEKSAPTPAVFGRSATSPLNDSYDIVLTDPPYYDAIPYSDLMDFFYVWLRRTVWGLSTEIDAKFESALGPKWNHAARDGELIDDASRHGGDKTVSRAVYEDGMYRAFTASAAALRPDGRLVVVFAHKEPEAWETLVSAIIRAGFVVDGSWPIQTEMGNRTRALASAALSSSVWLVCKKRPEEARPGWDNRVLEDMRANIHDRLRHFWDAGIHGPDFVWAATGPALEAYSRHPIVKKANDPGKIMDVSDFLRAVRRLVVDFVVGRVLTKDGDETSVVGLDDVTTYYLLHRHDFGLEDAPIGPCILYAVSCGLSDRALADQYDVLLRTGGQEEEDEAPSEDQDIEEGSGSKVRLKTWLQRKGSSMGYETGGRPAPLIDQIHRLMHLWKAGDQVKVNDYLDSKALRRNALFHQLFQALIELAPPGSEERSILESLSNHVSVRQVEIPPQPLLLPALKETGEESTPHEA